MKLHDTINVNSTIEQITSFLLDFEQYPKTELLLKVLNELQNLTQKLRKYFQLRNINSLINEMVILYSAAIEKELVLNIYHVDLTLHILDLIKSSCNIEYKDVNEIAIISDSISNKYNDDIKKNTFSVTLFKKTAYLKFDILTSKTPATKKEIENNSKYIDKSNFASKKALQNIVVNNTKQTTKSIHNNKQHIDKTDSFDVVDTARLNIQFTPTQENNFDIKELSNLISMLKSTVDMATDNTIKLTWQQVSALNRAARNIKNLASDKSVDLIDDTNKQLDKIDDFINSLDYVAEKNKNDAKNTTIKYQSNTDVLKNIVEYEDIKELVKSTIILNEIVNYNDYINEQFSGFKKLFDDITNSINTLKYNSNLDDATYKQITQLTDSVRDVKRQTDHFQNAISDKLMNAGINATSIYSQLSKMRSKPFADFLIGINEFVNLNAEAVELPDIKLQLKKTNLLISADLWQIFDNIIPWILRHIVLFNFDASIKTPQIIVDLNIFSGIVEILFCDNGKHIEVKEQTKKLREMILVVQNAGGKTYINSTQNGTKIKFRFQQENVLNTYVIVENEQQYYAIPIEYYLQFNPNEQQNIPTDSLTNLLNKLRRVNKKATNNNQSKHYILIRNEVLILKLIVDKVVKVATLSPQRLTGTFAKNYALGAAQYGNKSVLLLDVDAILKNVTAE